MFWINGVSFDPFVGSGRVELYRERLRSTLRVGLGKSIIPLIGTIVGVTVSACIGGTGVGKILAFNEFRVLLLSKLSSPTDPFAHHGMGPSPFW